MFDATEIPITPRPAGSPAPLTAVQRRLWSGLLDQGRKPSEMRTCAGAMRVRGPLDLGILEASLHALTERHESARAKIACLNGVPKLTSDDPPRDYLRVLDLTNVPAYARESACKRLAIEFLDERIDISLGPVFQARLVKFTKDEHVLVLGMDHLISDAFSWAILNKELWRFYADVSNAARKTSLPDLPVQFGDYALWQERTYESWCRKHLAYWQSHLSRAPCTKLPRKNGYHDEDGRFRMRYFALGRRLSDSLRDLARREATLLPLTMMAVYVVAISAWCEQRDVILTSMTHARHGRAELAGMVGFVANRHFHRVSIGTTDTFRDVLRKVVFEFRAAHEHHDFDRIPDLIPECTTEADFNWLPKNWTQPTFQEADIERGNIQLQPYPLDPFPPRAGPTSFKLVPLFSETTAGIAVTLLYHSGVFTSGAIETFGNNVRSIAANIVADPSSELRV